MREQLAKAAWKAIQSSEDSANAEKIALGEGSFVMVELVSALADSQDKAILAEVKKVLGDKATLAKLEASDRSGTDLLVQRLKAL